MRRLIYSPQTQVLVPNIFGDARDGDVVVSSNTTLTQDILARNYTINAGVTVITSGFRIFCTGTFTNNGVLQDDGQDAIGGSQGNGSGYGTFTIGSEGGGGVSVVGPGIAGTNQTGGISPQYGDGGQGGRASPQTQGAGGSHNVAYSSSIRSFTNIVQLLAAINVGNAATSSLQPGCGGGSGSMNAGSVGTSGAGGGGGGTIFIAAKYINNASGVIRAKGGNGGNASGTGNIGGGGGGGGGYILIACLTISQGSITAPGGTKGTSIGTVTQASDGFAGAIVITQGI